MKGGIGPHWWLTIFLLQTAFMPMSYSAANNCGESGSAILGLFDDNDNASISKFRSALEDLNAPGCQSKFKRKELLLNNQMSAMEAINATREAFLGENVCYVVYSSYSSIGRLALDIALSNGIPVVSTLSKKVRRFVSVLISRTSFQVILISRITDQSRSINNTKNKTLIRENKTLVQNESKIF